MDTAVTIKFDTDTAEEVDKFTGVDGFFNAMKTALGALKKAKKMKAFIVADEQFPSVRVY